jgi:hypothetical protein
MGIVNRNFTYHAQIKLSPEDLELARKGRKTCTIRLGVAKVAEQFINLSDGHQTLRVEITKVDNNRLYKDLTDQDAVLDGLESRQELDADLRRFYGDIDPMQPMTLIYFRLN